MLFHVEINQATKILGPYLPDRPHVRVNMIGKQNCKQPKLTNLEKEKADSSTLSGLWSWSRGEARRGQTEARGRGSAGGQCHPRHPAGSDWRHTGARMCNTHWCSQLSSCRSTDCCAGMSEKHFISCSLIW